MTQGETTSQRALDRLSGPLRLTRIGMAAERLTQAFWPLWSILLAVAAALALGVQDSVSVEVAWVGLVLSALAAVALLYTGFRKLDWPTEADAVDRLDRTLPGRPILALRDQQAVGSADAASIMVWQAHLARMAARTADAKAVQPDLKLARRDPFALRYVALMVFVIAVLFGSLWRVGSVADIATGQPAAAVAAGPMWEGWVQPPAYTGKPSLYLNDIKAATLSVPVGSRVSLRLYGEVGDLTLAETVSGRVGDLATGAGSDAGALTSASAATQDFDVMQSGTIRIDGPGGREWAVTVIPDAAPVVGFSGEIGREADGRMTQPFTASDDFAVVRGRAEITLDLARVDRRYGLTADPEPRDAVVLDLPMPISGDRANFAETLIDNLSEHPFANLPVRITLFAEDAVGQVGQSEAAEVLLPGRRFFDPLAAGIIEMRRDLLWSRDNAARVSQILRAITNRPEGFIRNQKAYLLLRVAMKRLDGGLGASGDVALAPEIRDEVAEALWEVALLVEEGDLADALERLRRAQDRLAEAIRRGADPAEIAELMQELNESMQEYIEKLAEQAEPGESGLDTAQTDPQSQEITPDQLQQMLDEIQRLMEEGRMAEAAALLEELRQMMENMQVTQGQGGQGQGGPGQQALKGLGDTLRDQQGLSDDAFSDLQEQFNPGPGQPGTGDPQGQGEQPGDPQDGGDPQNPGEGSGQGQDGDLEGSLAERQQALREQLERQSRNLPGAGTPEGDAAREALDRAGRAMDEAAEALEGNDIPGAIDRQAEAMEALRDGMRNLGEALAQQQQQQQQDGRDGQAFGQADPQGQRDPLGRELNGEGRAGTRENLLQGEDIYRRAREILDELRRRSSDQTRPSTELDYLRRLLNVF